MDVFSWVKSSCARHGLSLKGSIIASLVCLSPAAFSALPAIPSSGTCAMLTRSEIPFGINVSSDGDAGYPFSGITTLTFTSATSGSASSLDINVNYNTDDGPDVRNWGLAQNLPFTVTPMVDGVTGIAGGYLLRTSPYSSRFFDVNGQLQQGTDNYPSAVLHVFPVNGGRTLLVQGGDYPFTGVCQF